MNGEPIQARATKTTFVYDTRTGKVVHIHQFVPARPDGTCSDREMEETAVSLAPAAWDRANLAALHHDKDLELNPEHQYRVDIKSRRLVVEPTPLEPTQRGISKGDEPLQPRATKTTFVYDTRTGKVVHVHQFIPARPGGTCSDREMEEAAVNLAPAAWDRANLAVLHDDKELELNPRQQYRVDIKSRRLVVEPAPPEPAQGGTRVPGTTRA